MNGIPSAGCPRHGQLRLLVEDGLDPDGGQHQGGWQPLPEEVHAEVASGHVAEEPWHDPPAPEGFAVRPHGLFRPGSSRQEVEGLRLQLGLGLPLELFHGDGLPGRLPRQSPLVDLHLPLAARGNARI